MSRPLTAFQRNFLFFAKPQAPYDIKILSALRAMLRLGLNFPVSLVVSLSVRFFYAPFPHYLRPVAFTSVPQYRHRTPLESATLSQSSYTFSDLFALYHTDPQSKHLSWYRWSMDVGHLACFWMIAADVKTNRVDVEALKRFQVGDWAEHVARRRKSRMPGKGEVLPFWRGGPILVAPHSWAVGRLFGVGVYEP